MATANDHRFSALANSPHNHLACLLRVWLRGCGFLCQTDTALLGLPQQSSTARVSIFLTINLDRELLEHDRSLVLLVFVPLLLFPHRLGHGLL